MLRTARYILNMKSKLGHVFNVALALGVLFSLVGGVAKSGELLPLAVLTFIVIFWASIIIVGNGVASFYALRRGDKSE